MINGQNFDGESLKLTLPTGMIAVVDSVEYSDNHEDEAFYDLQGNFIGIGRGQYKADCKFDVAVSDYELINQASKIVGGLYNLPILTLVATYVNTEGAAIVDKIPIKIIKRGKKVKKGDKQLIVNLETTVAGIIEWNGVPAYTPK